MIQVNELRIGNYVDTVYNVPYIKITEIKKSVVCGEKCKGVSYGSLKPIPLTEEILLKCGLKQNASNLYVDDTRFALFVKDDYDGFLSCWGGVVIGECNYLHQLQNLYFALTGKELEVGYD